MGWSSAFTDSPFVDITFGFSGVRKFKDVTLTVNVDKTHSYGVFNRLDIISFLYVCMVNTIYLLSFVETPRKFIIAELSIRKLGSSSVLVLLALMKIRAYGSKALQ